MRMAGHRLTAAAAGSIVVVLVLVALAAVLIGPRLLARSQPAPRPAATPASSPSDPALKSYRDLAARDDPSPAAAAVRGYCLTDIDANRAGGFTQCRAGSLATKGAAQKYLDDLNSTTPPQLLSDQDSRLKVHLQQLIVALDERVAAIDSKSIDSVSAANTKVDQQAFDGVNEVAAEIRCWPAKVGEPPETGYQRPCLRS